MRPRRRCLRRTLGMRHVKSRRVKSQGPIRWGDREAQIMAQRERNPAQQNLPRRWARSRKTWLARLRTFANSMQSFVLAQHVTQHIGNTFKDGAGALATRKVRQPYRSFDFLFVISCHQSLFFFFFFLLTPFTPYLFRPSGTLSI